MATLTQIRQAMPAMYETSIAHKGPAFYIEGDPGCGKTTIFEDFPAIMRKAGDDRKMGVSVINGANFTLMTAMGFMIPKELQRAGVTYDVSRFTLPYWKWSIEGKLMHEYDGGYLIVDEADKLGPDEMKIVGEAALSKVLGNHKLDAGWCVVFLANYLRNRSGGRKSPMHLVNRRIKLEVQQDVEGWAEWARGEKLLPEVIQFAEENPQLLYEPMPEDERPWCTPRSLHQCDITLQSLMESYQTETIPTDPLTQEFMKGGIGAPATVQLTKTIRLGQELHSFEEVVAAPTTIEIPKRPDAQRLMSYKLASRVDEKTAKQVLAYMNRMPNEHVVMFARMAIQRNYQLAFQPDFAAWCGKNTALIAVLNRYKMENK